MTADEFRRLITEIGTSPTDFAHSIGFGIRAARTNWFNEMPTIWAKMAGSSRNTVSRRFIIAWTVLGVDQHGTRTLLRG